MKITKKLILALTLIFALTFTACSNEKPVNDNAKNQKYSQENDILDGNTMKNSTDKPKQKIVTLPESKNSNSNEIEQQKDNSIKDKGKDIQAKPNANKDKEKEVRVKLKVKEEKQNLIAKMQEGPKNKLTTVNSTVNNTNKPNNNKPSTNKPNNNKPSTNKPNSNKPNTNLNAPVNSEKELKNVLENSLLSYPDKLKITLGNNYNPDNWNRLNDLIKSILSNNVNFNYGFNRWQWERTSTTLTFIPNYSMPKDKLKAQNKEIDKKVEEIIRITIKNNMTELQKEKAIHDYLVNNTKYNYTNFKNQIYDPNDHSAYGPLILGTGVCEGYAKAMNLLLNKIGIESFMVTGLGNGGAHAWNIVKIDGNYYNVDATFDDPISNIGDILRYNYFNKSDRAISSSHSRDAVGNKLTKCTDTKYDNYSDQYWKKMK